MILLLLPFAAQSWTSGLPLLTQLSFHSQIQISQSNRSAGSKAMYVCTIELLYLLFCFPLPPPPPPRRIQDDYLSRSLTEVFLDILELAYSYYTSTLILYCLQL